MVTCLNFVEGENRMEGVQVEKAAGKAFEKNKIG